MNKEVKRKMWLQAVIFFVIGCAATGITYKLFNPEFKESNLKLIVLHVVVFGFSFLISYFGHKTALKKGQL